MGNFISSIKEGFNKGWLEGQTDSESFALIAKEIGTRLAKPIGSFPFWIYFLLVTLLTGFSGVFTTINQELQHFNEGINHANIILSMATYFIALLASASTDLIFLHGEENSEKQLKHLGVGMLLVGVGLFWLSVVSPKIIIGNIFKDTLLPITFFYYIPPVLGTLLALFTWWIANANNPNLNMKLVPENATPGSGDIKPDIIAVQKYNL